MAEDKNILRAIGGILQRWDAARKKKKSAERLNRGLESKLSNPQSTLTRRENKLLDTMLKRDEVVGRTDDAALMDVRSKFPGSI